ncbi:reverse transcriptase [Corchorus olitorius]|uniref:Reverse transcriptase n=1 Tax=Corchorus olitorius TaxID=93759 RepID=A0A1R3IL96_9ROSI|nr:reverse transcriptase [Corchorus olitorius]
MSCVCGASLTLLVNGSKTQTFSPSRGIRQGDPMSPYLFILCLEHLSIKINKQVEDRKWKVFKINRRAPIISHLFFADDLILCAKASVNNCNIINTVLSDFCADSGQVINHAKSKILFSQNTPVEDRASICGSLNIHEADDFAIPVQHHGTSSDCLCWSPSSDGKFKLADAYQIAKKGDHNVHNNWSWIWKVPCYPKIQHFIWILRHQRLVTRCYLKHIGVSPDDSCPLCNQLPETLDHLFRSCNAASSIWNQLNPPAACFSSGDFSSWNSKIFDSNKVWTDPITFIINAAAEFFALLPHQWLMNQLGILRLNHTLREGNQVADQLAKAATSLEQNFYIYNAVPNFISNLLLADLMGTYFPRTVFVGSNSQTPSDRTTFVGSNSHAYFDMASFNTSVDERLAHDDVTVT